MKISRRLTISTLALFALAPNAAFADQAAAETYIGGVLKEANSVMSADEQTRLNGIERLVDKHVDMRRTGRFVLGQYARKMTDEQAAVYHPLFRKYATIIYQNVLSNYSNEQLEVIDSKKRSDRDFIVNSRIANAKPNSQFANMKIHWRVHKDRKGKLTVFDAGADGIWLAIEQQSQFKSIISNNGGGEAGIDALIAELRRQVG